MPESGRSPSRERQGRALGDLDDLDQRLSVEDSSLLVCVPLSVGAHCRRAGAGLHHSVLELEGVPGADGSANALLVAAGTQQPFDALAVVSELTVQEDPTTILCWQDAATHTAAGGGA